MNHTTHSLTQMNKITLTGLALAVAALGLNSVTGAQTPTVARVVGGVEPVNIVLHDGQNDYVVPIGKVLVIENFIWALESDANRQTINLKPQNDPAGVGGFQLQFTLGSADMFTPEAPIRIVGDGSAGISILNNSQVDWRDVLITGTLRDI